MLEALHGMREFGGKTIATVAHRVFWDRSMTGSL
jgi:hypothetical protein